MTTLSLLGLPASGKSTFLGALTHVLTSGEVAGSLTISVLQPDESYINEIRFGWLKYEDPQRTGGVNEIRLQVNYGDSDVTLDVSDVSGEICKDVWQTRVWPTDFDSVQRQAAGFLLFIHVGKVVTQPTLTKAIQDCLRQAHRSGAKRGDPIRYDHSSAPTQVRLVDLLQMVRSRQRTTGSPTAVILSAWDEASTSLKLKPINWLKSRLPFLHSYLENTSPRWPYAVYGVSALGGKLTEIRARAESFTRASDRIIVVDSSGGQGADPSAPVRWLLDVGAH